MTSDCLNCKPFEPQPKKLEDLVKHLAEENIRLQIKNAQLIAELQLLKLNKEFGL